MNTEIDTTQIKNRIKMFVTQNLLFSDGAFAYSDDDSFLQQGIIDSLGVMQLVEFVQTDLKVQVEQEEISPENFDSVNKLAALVCRKLSATNRV